MNIYYKIFFVGNKIDLEKDRHVSVEEAEGYVFLQDFFICIVDNRPYEGNLVFLFNVWFCTCKLPQQ